MLASDGPAKQANETVITIPDGTGGGDAAAASKAADPARLALGPVRTNGFEAPYSKDQVIAALGHVLSAACLYVVSGSILLQQQRLHQHHHDATTSTIPPMSSGLVPLTLVALAIHVPVMILLVTSWASCERIDPAKDVRETLPNGWLGIKLRGPRWEKVRYCAVCRKTVPGLDHHCTWLQTCVGQANYAQFFTIACAGTVQFVSQVLYASFCLVWLELPFHQGTQLAQFVQGALVMCLLISVPCTIMYFILLGFHVYLYFLGYGTYEWMLRRRRAQRAKATAAAAAATAAVTAGSGNTPPAKRTSSTKESRESRHLSSVGSANEFVSADDESRTDPASIRSTRELTAL